MRLFLLAVLTCLAVVTSSGRCATAKRVPVIDHARAERVSDTWHSDLELVMNVPPEWAADPEIHNAQLTVAATGTRGVTLSECAYQPATEPPQNPRTDVDLYGPVFHGRVQVHTGPMPSELRATLRLGDRVHSVRLPIHVARRHDVLNTGPKPTPHDVRFHRGISKPPPALPLTVYTPRDYWRHRAGHEGDTYFRWDITLPKDFDPAAGELRCVANSGTVEGARVERGATTARLLGRFHPHADDYRWLLALELKQKDHAVAQLNAQLLETQRYQRGGPGLKSLWEQTANGVSGARVEGEAPKVLAYRAQGEGYLWVQIPTPAVDAAAYTVVTRATGAPLKLVAGTIETLLDHSVVHVVARFDAGGDAHLEPRLVRVLGGDEPPRALAAVDVKLPTADGGDARARKAWVFHLRKSLERKRYRAVSTAFFDYADRALARRADAHDASTEAAPEAEANARPQVDLLSAATGLLAVQEALQLDAMRGADTAGARTVDVSTLEGPKISSHPFAKMMQGRKPQLFGMDACAPADHVYAHASSFARALALSDDIESWGLDLAHMAEGRSVDSGVRERYTEALLVETNLLSRMFGTQVVADCGVVLADPFVREGTGAALILNLKDRALADAALAPRRKLAELKGVRTAADTYHGTATRCWTGGAVSLHEADAGTFRILATSRGLLERILDTHAGRRPGLASAPDYRYMRTIFPGDVAQEDAFLYLSDDFVRRMVSPAFKLAVRRRLLCAGRLTLVHNARLLARIEGRAGDLAALVKVGDLPGSLTCPDGDAYALDGEAASCPRHGRLDRLAPLAPELVTRATADEAKAYREFVEDYNNYWRTFFDPVGVRVRAGGGAKFETVILPLVDSTVYTGLRDTLGGPPAPLRFHGATPTTVLGLAFKTPTKLVEQLVSFTYADELTEGERPERWLGDEAAVVVHDAAPLFTLDFGRGSSLTNRMLSNVRLENLIGVFTLSSFDLPLVVSAAVKREDAAWNFVEKSIWRAMAAIERTRGFLDPRLDPYLVREGAPAPVLVIPIDFWAIKLRYYVSVHAGRIWLSNQLSALSASMQAGAPARTVTAHLAAAWLPGRGVQAAAERAQASAERLRRACLANLTPAWVILRLLGTAADGFAAEARSTLGNVPVCPEGGRYELEPATDEVQCSRHGSPERPRQRLAPDPASPAAQALARLKELFVSLEFTPEGLATRLELDVAP